MHVTRAPDYAVLGAEVDGKASSVRIDGYAPQVMRGEAVDLGTFAMLPGAHKVSFMIIGKNPQSQGYLVGIDRIQLEPETSR